MANFHFSYQNASLIFTKFVLLVIWILRPLLVLAPRMTKISSFKTHSSLSQTNNFKIIKYNKKTIIQTTLLPDQQYSENNSRYTVLKGTRYVLIESMSVMLNSVNFVNYSHNVCCCFLVPTDKYVRKGTRHSRLLDLCSWWYYFCDLYGLSEAGTTKLENSLSSFTPR